ncbi:MAG: UpxY family transcription antiterminator [Prevotella sp.]|nr:UpxY family transcription antiterminator [Prevotella sp.]
METVNEQEPWYAVRLFTLRLKEANDYFRNKDLETFIPMQWADFEGRDGKMHHELKPVVRNFVFVKKSITERQMRQFIQESTLKMSVIRKADSKDYYEIPARQMNEFRLMCNPEIELRKFVSEEEAHLKAGSPVLVKFGPLKGLTGRLVRQSKKYYLLKEVPGMGVMIKVSRWCCIPREMDE